jgi:hypothetical protein
MKKLNEKEIHLATRIEAGNEVLVKKSRAAVISLIQFIITLNNLFHLEHQAVRV